MLRYMVLSDSHRAGGWLARAAEIYAQGGFDGVIHLGDVHADARRFAELAGTTPLCVRGNCDSPLCPAPAERVDAGRRPVFPHAWRPLRGQVLADAAELPR